MTALVRASWRVVVRPHLLGPTGAALVLCLATVPVQDDGHAVLVLRGVGLLLAFALVAATDDPAAEVAAATPRTRAARTLTRLGVGLAVVVPVWVVAAVVARTRDAGTPVAGLVLEAVALAAVGVALGTGLRAWTGLATPSWVAATGLVVVALLADAAAPRRFALTPEQLWGPPWEASRLRWAALGALAVAVVALAVREPLADLPRGRSGAGRPEGDGRRGRHVERVDAARHGDAHDEVGTVDRTPAQAVALGPQHQGQPLRR